MTGGWRRPLGAPAIVYSIRNSTNGKQYIGVTSQNPEKRFRQHVRDARKGLVRPLALAIRKYGAASFELTVLKECATLKEAFEQEKLAIIDMKPSYNILQGGEGHLGPHTERTLEKLRASRQRPHVKASWEESRKSGPRASSKTVVCLDDGCRFESASAASRHYGVAKSALIELCLGRKFRKSVGGLRFQYVEEAA